MDSSVSLKDQIWFMRVCHHVSNVLYLPSKRRDGLWDPPSIVVNGYRGSCPGFKQPECDSDHTPPSRVKVKNTCSYTSSHPLRSRTIYMQLEVERSVSLSWSRHSQLCVTSKFSAISTTARQRSPPAPDDTTPHLHILHCHAVIFASYNSTAKMSQTRHSETSATNHPVRRRHIPHQRPHPAILSMSMAIEWAVFVFRFPS